MIRPVWMPRSLTVLALALSLVGVVACGGGAADAPDEAAMPDPVSDATPAESVPTYTLDPAWPPTLPNGWVMGVPTSVSVDPRNHVWVLHRPRTVSEDEQEHAAPAVLEFDADGAFVQGWGGPGDGYDWPDTEHGIFVDHENNVWITGINPRAGGNVSDRSDDMLLKFTADGTLLFQVGGYDASGGNADTANPRQPADMGIHAATGEVFVADGYGNRRVWVLDAETGAFKRRGARSATSRLMRSQSASRARRPRRPTQTRRSRRKGRARTSSVSCMGLASRTTGTSTWRTAATGVSRCSPSPVST